jgi:hypothetical protein
MQQFVVGVVVSVTVDAATPELAGAAAVAALAAAGFPAAYIDDVIDVDEPLDITITKAGLDRLSEHEQAQRAAGKLLVPETR